MTKTLPPHPENLGECYERGIRKLIEKVSRIHKSEREKEWNSTAKRKAIEEIAKKLEETADLLTSGSAQFDIESFHDERGIPERAIGLDGWPVENEETDWPSYQSIKSDIRLLAESARQAAEQVPNSRKRFALSFAARGFLHLRHDYGFPPVAKYKDSADVIELERVCSSAGMVLSRESYLGALTDSLKTFDPHFTEPEYRPIYQ